MGSCRGHPVKAKQGWKKPSPLIDKTYLALSNLPWFGNIQGFNNEEPISDLARYITHEWLTDVHKNQKMLTSSVHALTMITTSSAM
jgi:hypothetical protein